MIVRGVQVKNAKIRESLHKYEIVFGSSGREQRSAQAA